MKVPNKFRVRTGVLGSTERDGNNGCFLVEKENTQFMVIASDGMGWEHVSVSLGGRTPTWEEMCFIKDLFWDEDDCVIQFHPPKSEYVNNHPYCLHLWKPKDREIPMPPRILVGFK